MPLFGPPDVDKMKKKADIGGLIKALGDYRDPGIPEAAVKALVEIGTPAVDPLIAVLKDKRRSHIYAALALGQIGDARAVEALSTVLHDDFVVPERQAAATALGQIGRPAVEALVGALSRQHGMEVRWLAAEQLGKIGDPRAVKPLIQALTDMWSPWEVRASAVRSLGQIGDGQAAAPLVAALKDADREVQLRAQKAVKEIGRPAVEPLLAALQDADPDLRADAAKLLGQIGDPRAVEPLCTALRDGELRVRQFAAEALGLLRDARAVEPLVAALGRADPHLLTWAGFALAKIGGERAVEGLVLALQNEKRPAGVPAGSALVGFLVLVLPAASPALRSAAMRALGQTGGNEAVLALIDALQDSAEEVRNSASEALVGLYRSGGLDNESRARIPAQIKAMADQPHDTSGPSDTG